MAIRRELVGILLIALTASTIVTLFMAGEKAKRNVEVLENTFPQEIKFSGRNTFSLGLIARKPLSVLQVEFASLHANDVSSLSPERGKFGRKAVLSLSCVSTLYEMADSLGVSPIEYEMKVERNKTKRDMYVFDFSGILRRIVGDDLLGGYAGGGATSVYAAVFNETGIGYFYSGFKDFFYPRNSTITELTITYNDESQTYKRQKELSKAEIQSGVPTVMDAPPVGSLIFDDVKKDDTVRIAFSVDRAAVPFRDGLELIGILSEGQADYRLANFMFAS